MAVHSAVEIILIVGASHRSSSLALRDQMYVDEAAAPAFLHRLTGKGMAQVAVLSTSERVEVAAITHNPAAAVRLVTMALAEWAGLEGSVLARQLYSLTGAEAVRHCFSVAAGLDSLVIGDPHVLGQLMEAQRTAQAAGTSGNSLDQLLTAACKAAKRVRAETGIAEGPVSIAAAAVQLARHLHGNLTDRQVLLVGTGDMGGLVADGLRRAGVRQFVVTVPHALQAEAAAAALVGHMVLFTDLVSAIAAADIVVSSVSDQQYVIETELVQQALRRRRQRPIFLVDAGIPGDVEPAVNYLNNAFLYDLNDLERVAMEGRASRERSARAAWSIVTAEVAMFLKGRRERRPPAPALEALQRHFERVRAQVLNEATDTDHATRLLVTRLLRTPLEALQRLAARGDIAGPEREAAERALRQLLLPDELGENIPAENTNSQDRSGRGLI